MSSPRAFLVLGFFFFASSSFASETCVFVDYEGPDHRETETHISVNQGKSPGTYSLQIHFRGPDLRYTFVEPIQFQNLSKGFDDYRIKRVAGSERQIVQLRVYPETGWETRTVSLQRVIIRDNATGDDLGDWNDRTVNSGCLLDFPADVFSTEPAMD